MRTAAILSSLLFFVSSASFAQEVHMDAVKEYSERESLRKNSLLNVYRDTRGIPSNSSALNRVFAEGDEIIMRIELEDPEKLNSRLSELSQMKNKEIAALSDEIEAVKKQISLSEKMVSSKDPRIVEKYKKIGEESQKELTRLTQNFLKASKGTEYQITVRLGQATKDNLKPASQEQAARDLISEYQKRGFRVTAVSRVPALKVLEIDQLMAKGLRSAGRSTGGIAAAGAAIGIGAATASAAARAENAPYKPAMRSTGAH